MLSTVEADYITDNSFYSPSKWERNAKGNLWRRFNGKLLTVFKQGPFYSWSINAGPKAVTFSPRAFKSEGEAMSDLGQFLTSNRTEGQGKSIAPLSRLSNHFKVNSPKHAES